MKILAFETSSGSLSAALLEDQKILEYFNLPENGRQAELLVSCLEDILQRHKIWYNDLAAIATTKGPGSFTGVRIALAAARGLKIATGLPLIALDALEVIAYKNRSQQNGKMLVAVDARMDEFFVAEFLSQNNNITRLTDSRLATKAEFEELAQKHNFVCGTAKAPEDIASADFIGLMAYEKLQENSEGDKNDNPTYLRQPKISVRKK